MKTKIPKDLGIKLTSKYGEFLERIVERMDAESEECANTMKVNKLLSKTLREAAETERERFK